jgi:hypothetical protein
MRIGAYLLAGVVATLCACAIIPATPATSASKRSNLPEPLTTLKPGHPRLLASATTWDTLKTRRRTDPLLDSFLKRGEVEARALLTVPPVVYKKDGKRLLHVSRRVLRRVLLLSLHYHLTGDKVLARRAEEEMLAAAAFTDWNPSHFLDVGEMTAALAFGYDWLYDQLDPQARKAIGDAIIAKGLRPGAPEQGWDRVQNNWNSVCLGGLSLGALAVAEEEPALAAQILNKARTNNANGLKPYAPDGVYPEGAMYWGYGTTFEVILLDALQSALGTDWGLSKSPGFMASAQALYQQLAPSETFFNFSDNVERPGSEPAMWWYAHTLKRPELLRYEQSRLKSYATSSKPPQPAGEDDRLLPLAALWWPEEKSASTTTTLPLNWLGRGPNELAVFRSAWNDPQAMYLALKAGGASLSHAHMDAGSFVFEANGVRWASDLGMQDYLSLESKGVDMWNGKQDGGRWSVYRLGPFSHSTLVIDNQLHRVEGLAHITHFSGEGKDTGAIVDLSPVFKGQASRVNRGFIFRPGSHTLLRDELEGLRPGAVVRWAMLTRAEVALSGTEATLTQKGKQLKVSLRSSVGAKWEVIPADPPQNDYDAPNPGARLLIANLTVPESGKLDLSVLLLPESITTVSEKLAEQPLSKWPQTLVK